MEKNNKLMPITCEKAKHIINACIDAGYPINTYKLEKLLLLVEGYLFATTHQLFFNDNIKITKSSGLRIPTIYKCFIANSVEFAEKCREYICLLDNEKKAIDLVLDMYGYMNPFDLASLENLEQINNAFNDGEMITAQVFVGMISPDTIHKFMNSEGNQPKVRKLRKQQQSK